MFYANDLIFFKFRIHTDHCRPIELFISSVDIAKFQKQFLEGVLGENQSKADGTGNQPTSSSIAEPKEKLQTTDNQCRRESLENQRNSFTGNQYQKECLTENEVKGEAFTGKPNKEDTFTENQNKESLTGNQNKEDSLENQNKEDSLPENENKEDSLPENQTKEDSLPGNQTKQDSLPGNQNKEDSVPWNQSKESLAENQNKEDSLAGKQNKENSLPGNQSKDDSLVENQNKEDSQTDNQNKDSLTENENNEDNSAGEQCKQDILGKQSITDSEQSKEQSVNEDPVSETDALLKETPPLVTERASKNTPEDREQSEELKIEISKEKITCSKVVVMEEQTSNVSGKKSIVVNENLRRCDNADSTVHGKPLGSPPASEKVKEMGALTDQLVIELKGMVTMSLDELDNQSGVLHVFFLIFEGLASAVSACPKNYQPQTLEALFQLMRSAANVPGESVMYRREKVFCQVT